MSKESMETEQNDILEVAKKLVNEYREEGYTNISVEDQKIAFDIEDGRRMYLQILPFYGPERGRLRDELRSMIKEHGQKE